MQLLIFCSHDHPRLGNASAVNHLKLLLQMNGIHTFPEPRTPEITAHTLQRFWQQFQTLTVCLYAC